MAQLNMYSCSGNGSFLIQIGGLNLQLSELILKSGLSEKPKVEVLCNSHKQAVYTWIKFGIDREAVGLCIPNQQNEAEE